MLDRGKEKGKKERQEERISGDTRSARVRPKGHHPGDTFGSTLLGSLRVSCSLPHPRDVHFCSLARLQGQRNMGWSARKWRNYIRGREKGGCKSKRRLLLSLSLSVSRCSREMVEGEGHELVIYRREVSRRISILWGIVVTTRRSIEVARIFHLLAT